MVASGATAREAHEAAGKKTGHHYLFRVPETDDLFIGGYAR